MRLVDDLVALQVRTHSHFHPGVHEIRPEQENHQNNSVLLTGRFELRTFWFNFAGSLTLLFFCFHFIITTWPFNKRHNKQKTTRHHDKANGHISILDLDG